VAAQVIECEAPVQEQRLIRLVASAFDLSRVAAGRADAIRACLPTKSRDEDGFYWVPARPRGTWLGFRRPVDEPRPLGEVSVLEIINAMVALCVAGAGMEREELLRATVEFFGGRRLTSSLRQRAEIALMQAISRGRLVSAGNGMVSVPR